LDGVDTGYRGKLGARHSPHDVALSHRRGADFVAGAAQLWIVAQSALVYRGGFCRAQARDFRQRSIGHWEKALLCPDADRNLCYSMRANRVGLAYKESGDLGSAEKFFAMGADPPAHLPTCPPSAIFRCGARRTSPMCVGCGR